MIIAIAHAVLAATLAQNVAAVTNAAAEIDAAIVAKGGTTAGGLTNAANAILALPSGGGDERELLFEYPSDWPVAQVKAAWTNAYDATYPNRIVCLLANPKTITLTIDGYVWGAKKIVTSDGSTYTGSGTYTHTFATADRYVWVILCQSSSGYWRPNQNPNIPTMYTIPYIYGGNGSRFYDIDATRRVYVLEGDDCSSYGFSAIQAQNIKVNSIVFQQFNAFTQTIDVKNGIGTSALPSVNNTFYNNTALREIRGGFAGTTKLLANTFSGCYALRGGIETFDTSKVQTSTSAYNGIALFYNCYSLTNVPSIMPLDSCLYFENLFRNCYSLTAVPDALVFTNASSAAAMNNIFVGCYSLRRLPTHLEGPNKTYNYTISFADSTLVSADSFAEFTGDAITGGMIHNLNDVTLEGYTRTITLPTTLRAKFTSDQAAAIISAANAKGWTLGNFAQ